MTTQANPSRPPERSIRLTQVVEWQDGTLNPVEDSLAAEDPLEIRINHQPVSVTMRTPGHDQELAAGFLLSEGMLDSDTPGVFLPITSIRTLPGPGGTLNGVDVTLENYTFNPAHQRNFVSSSSCGVCGRASIESIHQRNLAAPNPAFRFDPDLLCRLPDRLAESQAVFARTGGLHAAALFNASGELIVVREDIGRHNAVDKVIGWALQNHLVPLSNHLLLVSGRAGFEIAQKAISAGIPILASVSAPSSLAVQLARELGLSLAGFLRGRRFVLYAGAERLQAGGQPPQPTSIG